MSSVKFEKAELPKQRTFGYLKNQPTLSLGDIKRLDENAGNQPPQLQQDDGLPSGWKPLSLSAPIISAVAILSLLIAAAVEVLAQKSQQDGGLALSPTQDDIPQYAMIFYLYGPNVVAVLYSLIWSWIDLDTKRMQPWFELSKPEGATAANSLFLDYPYEFVAFVPWKAAKRKHWPVFLSGLTMMLVFWAVTPLQSAVLGLGSVKVVKDVDIVTRGRLIELSKQADLLDPRVLNTGYAIGWLNQPFPPFTTPEYGLLPFFSGEHQIPKTSEYILSTMSTKLSTDLDCWPASVSRNGPPARAQFDFLDGQGCNATINFDFYSPYTMLYVGYYSNPYSDFALSGDTCPESENSTHLFLAIWARTINDTKDEVPHFDITAMYCLPRYWKQHASISVSSQGFVPNEMSSGAIGKRISLSDDEFNRTAFEYLLANGVAASEKPRDVPFKAVVEQHPRLVDMNLTRTVSNMVGYALAGTNRSIDAYRDPGLLHEVFTVAHQRLFSVAISTLSTNTTRFTDHAAKLIVSNSGILVSRPISLVLEILLALISISTLLLLWSCIVSPSNLPANPSSISRLAELCSTNPHFLRIFSSAGTLSETSLRAQFSHLKVRLGWRFESGVAMPLVIVLSSTFQPRCDTGHEIRKPWTPVRLKVLQKTSGIIFVAVFVAVITALVCLQWQVNVQHGLRRPTDNFEILQILENFVPTIVATFIEPFWVLLNRLLCVLQPFKELWSGNASQRVSVDTTYTAIPPQLSIKRAFRSSHYLLASVCSMALLANGLSLGLGALFNEAPVLLKDMGTFYPLRTGHLNGSSVPRFSRYLSDRLKTTALYQDHMYVVMANMTLGTPLPPWTSSEYFFQPFESKSSMQPGSQFSVISRGFGVSFDCTATHNTTIPTHIAEPPSRFDNLTTCPDPIDIAKSRIRHSTLTRPLGISAIEYSNTLSADILPCDRNLTFGWARTPKGQDMTAGISASFTSCKPILKTAVFNVVVNRRGYVHSYEQKSQTSIHTDKISSSLMIQANYLLNNPDIHWHNDTLSRSWMSYFIVEATKSRKSLDPVEPVPNPDELMPVIRDLYRCLFAVLLSLNQHLFEYDHNAQPSTGLLLRTETRIFMDRPALIICLVILALNITVATTYYSQVTTLMLPRMPSTIGSVLSYIAPSRAIKILGKNNLGLGLRTLSFGRYISRDGRMRMGIELDPYVVRITPGSLSSAKLSKLSTLSNITDGGE